MFVSIHSYSNESWDGKTYKVQSEAFDIEKENNEKIKITASNYEVPNTGAKGGICIERHRDLIILLSNKEIAKIAQFAIDNNILEMKAAPKE
ncbi:hypothetical protein [Syntrophotalea acetylenica]|uniref:Uncharacterized protein n=1 Tax=Syntrophotalea acetylenica TaxID=29542 RepID=A0A1L3GE95_SYNAC|nr:hypothetical protein [Syntrophotalea acetylenica]APG24237.1 hypothetical protein A7E75_03700 [Syntrophotalea acetylenica]APG44818.1 hypothetical protein A6070_12325 [Syntrophotalea acetylenica]